MSETVNILGNRVDCLNVEQLLTTAVCWAFEDTPRTIFYVNAHCMNTACSDPEYRKTLEKASLVYADGSSIVWSSRILGGCRLEKMTGADWIEELCALAVDRDLKLYFLGGKPGVAETAARNLQNRYPGLKIVGFSDGYFQLKSQESILEEISFAHPNIVFAGMSTPLQEKWIDQFRPAIAAPVCWAVGGLFEYLSGDRRRAPAWMSALGLEWLWILIFVQPQEKWRRYLLGNPIFVYRVLRQRLFG